MQKAKLLVRCYAEKEGDLWVAICLDFNLAAQADSYAEARRKLHDQILEYVYDAMAGEDVEHAAYLLRRRAPAPKYLKWFWFRALRRMHMTAGHFRAFFDRNALQPQMPKCA